MAADHQVGESGQVLDGFPVIVSLEAGCGDIDAFRHVKQRALLSLLRGGARFAFFNAVEFRDGA